MILKKISLSNFKNYELEQLEFSSGVNCFVGKNGMGKTNLLDAIYYMCMCKSNFAVNDRNIVRKGEPFFRLEGAFLRNELNEKLVCKVIPGTKKTIELDDVPYAKILEHIGHYPIVMIIPDDTLLATEGSENRRRFMDMTLSQMDQDYLRHLMAYNRVLKQRNAALKAFAKQGNFQLGLINTYNQQLLEPAAYISEKRKHFCTGFEPVFAEVYKNVSGDAEQVEVNYKSHLLEEDFEDLLIQTMERDRILQRTTIGIHKDDLVFKIDEFALKKFASQGQLKSFVLSMKLAQYELLYLEKNIYPILLLDDIFDKLDGDRVRQVLELITNGKYGQTFISDTHPNRVQQILTELGIENKQLKIENGKAVLIENEEA